jgi:hypothetical protein
LLELPPQRRKIRKSKNDGSIWNYCMQQDFLINKCQLQFRIPKTNFQLLQTDTNRVKLKEICTIVGEKDEDYSTNS